MKKKLTVLVCDDSMLVRKKLRNQLLALAEMDVLEAEDGATAVELYRENKPDLVFMDIVMPVKDGIVALEEIVNRSGCAGLHGILVGNPKT